MVIPVAEGSHWIMIAIWPEAKAAYTFDSLGLFPDSVADTLRELLPNYHVHDLSLLVQTDAFNCGVWAADFAHTWYRLVTTESAATSGFARTPDDVPLNIGRLLKEHYETATTAGQLDQVRSQAHLAHLRSLYRLPRDAASPRTAQADAPPGARGGTLDQPLTNAAIRRSRSYKRAIWEAFGRARRTRIGGRERPQRGIFRRLQSASSIPHEVEGTLRSQRAAGRLVVGRLVVVTTNMRG